MGFRTKMRANYKLFQPKSYELLIMNNQCPICALIKTRWKRRLDWKCCSTKCSKSYKENTKYLTWAELRQRVFERDNFTCAICQKRFLENTEINGYKIPVKPSHFLIADHILPLAIGGDQWNIDNIQTLCKSCNKIKTAKDMGLIAWERKAKNTKKLEVKV